MSQYFEHPNRLTRNVEGPFYTTGCPSVDPESVDGMIGDCLQCEAPEHEAPKLLAELNESNLDTYFVRQPQNEAETERACNAIRVCCVCALRYGGKDLAIIRKLENNPEYCDHIVNDLGELVITIGSDCNFLPFATDIAKRIRESYRTPDAG